MPPPEDPAVVDKSHEVVDTLHGIFGSHPGKRPGMASHNYPQHPNHLSYLSN